PDRDTLWALLKGAVLAADPVMIDNCPSGGEGIGCLFQENIKAARSWDEYLKAVKTKRYTYARLRRLSMQVLMGITRSRYPQRCPAYLSVLACNDQGRHILESMREKSGGLPVILDPGRDSARLDGSASSMLALDLHAAEIYHRITRRDPAAEPVQSGNAAYH
ncbi:MAG: nucleotidyltransferase family protein, partial [Eubacteriales bacterium]|nr:nucleotidyltransferase family protein [Eubacteriales bacterium]